MKEELIRDEGKVVWAYQDSLGFWTIGVGRLIDHRKGGHLSDQEIGILLDNDVQACLQDIQTETWFLALQTESQRRALVNLRFQLGSVGIRSFKQFLDFLVQKDWANAAKDLSQTKLARQAPARVHRLCLQIDPNFTSVVQQPSEPVQTG